MKRIETKTIRNENEFEDDPTSTQVACRACAYRHNGLSSHLLAMNVAGFCEVCVGKGICDEESFAVELKNREEKLRTQFEAWEQQLANNLDSIKDGIYNDFKNGTSFETIAIERAFEESVVRRTVIDRAREDAAMTARFGFKWSELGRHNIKQLEERSVFNHAQLIEYMKVPPKGKHDCCIFTSVPIKQWLKKQTQTF